MQSRTPLKTLGVTLMAALALVGAGALVVVAGAAGGGSSSTSSTANGLPVAATGATKMGADSVSALYQRVKDGVVYVQSTTAQGEATGSGFVLDTDGNVITNEHVIDGATDIKVRVGTKGALVPATLVGADASKDLALLKVDPQQTGTLHPLALAESKDVQVGESVIAIGSPFGLQGTLTSGIVSALDRSIQSPGGATISGVIQTDAAINPGNSGGPLIDAQGRIVGINAQIASESGSSAGIGFAIPSDNVQAALAELKSGTNVQQTQDQQQQLQQQEQGDQSGDQSDPYGEQTDPYGEQSDPSQGVDPSQLTQEQLQQLEQQLQGSGQYGGGY